MGETEPLGAQPLVACGLCGNIVDQAHVTKKEIETPTGPVSVWICKTCMHLGSQGQTQKYVMKENKKLGREGSR